MPTKVYVMMFVDLALVTFAIWAILRFLRRKRLAREEREAELAALLSDIELREAETRRRVGPDLYESPLTVEVIGFNRQAREMIIGTLANPTYIPFDKIVQVDVITGETSITRVDRAQATIWPGSDFADTLTVRSALLADRITREMISDLSIKVTIDHWDDPVHTACFLRAGDRGIDPRSDVGSTMIAAVDEICAKVRMIIRERSGPAPGAPGDMRLTG